jgi:hypothetical protein
MGNKLTLNIADDVVAKAKIYASEQNISLSSFIESFLRSVTSDKRNDDFEEIEISPFVKSLSLKSDIPADFDYKAELGNYYSEKYK